jgi:MSHA biogenesis protein MshM
MPMSQRVLRQRLQNIFNEELQSPGIGLLTGEPGVGKTVVLRSLTHPLNPHRYQVLYQSETDFARVDIYRGLARALGIEPSYRRAQLWRDIKESVHEMVDSKQLTPLWIIDEAREKSQPRRNIQF